MGIAFERRAAACRALARLFPLLALALAIAWPGTSRAAECPIDIISATVEHGGSVTIDIPPCRASAMAMGAAPTCGSATFVDVTQTQILYDHDEIACPDATGDQFEFFGPTFDTIIVQVTIEAGGGGGPPPPPPPVALPDATVGVAYDEAIGPTGVATYTLTAGALPAGLALDNGTASISGTPTAAGNFAFTITATDFATSTPVPADFTLVVGAPTVVVGGAGTYNVDQGLSGADMLQANGGTAPYAFAVTDGALPPGMSLAADGTFSGTFTTAGTFSFDVTATDSSTGTGAPFTGTASFTFEVAATAPTITLSPATLDDGTVGVAYAASLSADGGTAPYAFAVTAGALPSGLSLAEDGSLSGTPSVAGTANFTVTATDDDGFTGSQALSITVVDALTASISAQTNIACAGGTTGAATVLASGGTAPYTYAWSNSATTATISGLAAGTYDVTVTDDNGLTATAQALITEPDPLAFTSGTLPDGTVGVVYSQLLGTSGGTGANTFSIIGVLPDGLTLSGATISGTPTTAGTSTFEVEVQDANACSRTIEYQITIAAAAPTITLSPASLPDGYAGTPGYYGLDYSATLSASGGTAPYTYGVTEGQLPDGLRLDADTGVVSGMPVVIGTYAFTVTATDVNGFEGTGSYSILLRHGLSTPRTSTTDATCAGSTDGTATVTASGGAAPYTYLWSTGENTATISALVAGQYNVTVTDDNGVSAMANAVVGEPDPLDFDTAELPAGIVGEQYVASLSTSGGTGDRTYSIVGSLPAGLSLVGNEIRGTSLSAGTTQFDVMVQDANACRLSVPYSITIEPRPVIDISPGSLPVFRTDAPVSIQLTASGGTPPYTFRSYALPGGITVSESGLIGGAPSPATDHWTTIEAVDARGFVGKRSYRFMVIDELIATIAVVADVTCPGGRDGKASVGAKGGLAPYNYAWSNGGTRMSALRLPAGDASVTVTSGDGQSTTAVATIGQPQPILIDALPAAVAGSPYSHALSVSGGTGTATVAFPRGLPAGYAYGDGVLSGTPTQAGTVAFDATVRDTRGCVAQQRLYLTVAGPVAPVTADDVASTEAGEPVQIPVTENDTGAIDRISIGDQPANGSATIDGLRVTYVPAPGFIGEDVFHYYAYAGDQASRLTTVTVTVSPRQLKLRLSSFRARYNVAFSEKLQVEGGTPPYMYSATGLPDGLALGERDGVLSGVPTQSGNFRFDVTVTDSGMQQASRRLKLSVGSADIELADGPLPDGQVGARYSASLAASGGIAPYVFSVADDALPRGIELVDGALSGTPTQPGMFFVRLQATDANGETGSRLYALRVADADVAIVVGPATLPAGKAGEAYFAYLSASGGTTPYTYSVEAGDMPAGLVFSTDGTIQGTPGEVGEFKLTVTATDERGREGTGELGLSITADKPSGPTRATGALQGEDVKLDLVSDMTGGPFVAAAIVSVSPGAGTVSQPVGPDFSATLALSDDFTGVAQVTYTLSNAYATSDPLIINVDVAARPFPAVVFTTTLELQGLTADTFRESFQSGIISEIANASGVRIDRITIGSVTTAFAPAPMCGPLDWHTPGSPCRQPMLGDEQMPVQAPVPEPRDRQDDLPPPFRLWTAGTVRFGDQDARGGGDGFEFETSGVSIGADRRFAESLLLGGAIGYGRDVTDVGTDGGRNEAQAFNAAFYGRYQPGPWFTYLIVGHQSLSFDLERDIEQNDNRVRGERDGHQWFASLGGGYEFDGATVDVSPYARLDLANGQLDAYVEHGDPLYAVAYEAMDLRSTTVNFGLRMDGSYARDWGVFSPHAELEYQRDADDGAVARVRYADLPDGPLYRIELPGFDRNRLMFGVGFGVLTKRHLSLQIQWRTLLGNEHRTDNSVQVSVSKRF